MPNPNAVVDFVAPSASSLDVAARDARTGPGPQYVTVPFQAGRSGRLDLSKPQRAVWASVLDSMRQAGTPAYVEIDPATSEITDLRVPLTVGVENITPVSNDMEVELVISQAKHFLRRTNPDFAQLLDILERARADKTLVAVTETEEHDIIDVRPLSGRSVTAGPAAPAETRRDPKPAVAVTLGRRSRCSTWSVPRFVAQPVPPRHAFHSTTPMTAVGAVHTRCAG
jgi:hypothetical protein